MANIIKEDIASYVRNKKAANRENVKNSSKNVNKSIKNSNLNNSLKPSRKCSTRIM